MPSPWKTCNCCGREWHDDDYWRSDTKFIGHQETEENETWPTELRNCGCGNTTSGEAN